MKRRRKFRRRFCDECFYADGGALSSGSAAGASAGAGDSLPPSVGGWSAGEPPASDAGALSAPPPRSAPPDDPVSGLIPPPKSIPPPPPNPFPASGAAGSPPCGAFGCASSGGALSDSGAFFAFSSAIFLISASFSSSGLRIFSYPASMLVLNILSPDDFIGLSPTLLAMLFRTSLVDSIMHS